MLESFRKLFLNQCCDAVAKLSVQNFFLHWPLTVFCSHFPSVQVQHRALELQVAGGWGGPGQGWAGPWPAPPGVQVEVGLAALGPHPPEGGVEGVGRRPVWVEAGVVVHLGGVGAHGGGSFTRPAILAACRGPETAARLFREMEHSGSASETNRNYWLIMKVRIIIGC